MYAVVRNAASLFSAYDPTKAKTPTNMRNAKFSMDRFFLKPIQVVDRNYMAVKMRMSELMEIYQ
jgi:hypothetical protein